MQLYEARPIFGNAGSWHGTRADAHAAARLTPTWDGARVYLWDIPTDKPSVLDMLNGTRPAAQLLQVWGLSPRLGLRDILLEAAQQELQDDEPTAGAPEAPARRQREDTPTQGAGESAQAFWARVTAEEEAHQASKGRRKPPTDEELDQL